MKTQDHSPTQTSALLLPVRDGQLVTKKSRILPAFLRNCVTRSHVVIKIPKNKIIPQPIHLQFANTLTQPRPVNFTLNLEANSSATIIEEYSQSGAAEIKVTITVAANATINYCKFYHGKTLKAAVQTKIILQSGSNATINYLIDDHASVDENLQVILHENATSKILGGCRIQQKQNVDIVAIIEHLGGGATSDTLFKYALSHNGQGSFIGKILVPAKVRRSTAKLYNKNLLLSPKATIHTEPILEIYAEDVAAHHGATVGKLDEAALFYLQTRGLTYDAARELLVTAFLAEITEQSWIKSIRNKN